MHKCNHEASTDAMNDRRKKLSILNSDGMETVTKLTMNKNLNPITTTKETSPKKITGKLWKILRSH